MQPNTEISHRSSNLFNATEVAETIGTDLETINEWLEVGAIDRAVFGGGRSPAAALISDRILVGAFGKGKA